MYLREMRSTLRERNVLLYVLVVPLLLYPFLLWLAMTVASLVSAEVERSPVRITIAPPDAYLARALQRHQVRLLESKDPQVDLRNGRLDAIVRIDSNRSLTIEVDGRYRQSLRARQRLKPLLERYREVRQEQLALAEGATLNQLQPFYYLESDDSSAQDTGRFVLGTFLPMILLVVLSLGGLYPAVETMAGEHERQTFDTTLGLAVPRWQIVVSKYMLVVSLCCLSGLCNLLAVTLSLRAILTPLSSTLAERISWGWSPEILFTMALGILLMSMFVAAATLLFTAHAKTFRAGQAATTPLFMSILIPSAALVDRGLTLNGQTCWLPVINVTLMWRDSLTTHLPWALVAATATFSLAWVGLILVILTWRLRYQSRVLQFGSGRRLS
jgi:sodium transport system permease protein